VQYRRLPIEIESPEERGYDTIRNNLTESSVRDRTLGELGVGPMDDLVLAYLDHRGDPRLRSLIAEADGLDPSNVLATPGAAAALFMVATAALERGDHVVVQHTNYSTNLETPRLIGAEVDLLDVSWESGFRFDLEELTRLVKPGVTKLISLTVPHNPTGTMITLEDLSAVVTLAESSGAWLLVDETYRGLTHGESLPSASTLTDRAVAVSSMSKTFGIPGIRMGWATTTSPEMAELLLAAKEQIVITGSALDEAVAAHALANADRLLAETRAMMRSHLKIVTEWIDAEPLISWVAPSGGVVCFPRLAEDADPEVFVREANERGTFVGEGHWFDADRHHFRLGYGWPTTDELRAGLADLSEAAKLALR